MLLRCFPEVGQDCFAPPRNSQVLFPDFVEPISKPLVLAKLPFGLLQTTEEIACARGVVDQKLDLAHAEIMQSRKCKIAYRRLPTALCDGKRAATPYPPGRGNTGCVATSGARLAQSPRAGSCTRVSVMLAAPGTALALGEETGTRLVLAAIQVSMSSDIRN
jgi:hypothetical protein